MVIAGYGGMARQRIGAGPGAAELQEIDRAADRATQLTRQLLAYSRQQVLEPVLLDLNEVVGVITPMLTRLISEDIEIGVLAGADAPLVLADRGQIEQVIVNFAVNARDAMPDGGTLTIETRKVRLDERYAVAHPGVVPGIYACLSVTDTGTGIDSETQARIFEPFFTTKEVGAGTGLGLATVHGIVKQSGGHVDVYSELGLGTTFKIYLPAAAGTAVADAAVPSQPAEQLTGTETVLVCEDDELVRALIESILIENGYRVLSASLPDEALRIAAEYKGEIDALATDVVMPRMSGSQLVDELTRVRPGLKALLLSGYSAEMLRERDLPVGSVFLQKPFDDVTLLAKLREVIDADVRRGDAVRRRGA
jgi:two-component system cell cycle sensor histidine kinase/response regulator CckA